MLTPLRQEGGGNKCIGGNGHNGKRLGREGPPSPVTPPYRGVTGDGGLSQLDLMVGKTLEPWPVVQGGVAEPLRANSLERNGEKFEIKPPKSRMAQGCWFL